MGGEEPACSAEEPRTGDGLLIGQDLGVGQPAVVVDGGVDVVIAGAATPFAVPVTQPVLGGVSAMGAVAATLTEPAQLLTSMWISSPGRARS